MDTDGVRLFVLAAEKLNISAAGQTLGMAPAVASAKLAKLEKSLNADLLHRSTRKVSLSLQGSEFLPYAREIISQEDSALAALGLKSAEPKGTLRFAAPSTFAQRYIVSKLPEFRKLYPMIQLDLRLSDTQFDLIDGSFDLALRNSALADSSLIARKLADDIRVLCASPTYLAQRGQPKLLEELKEHDLIGFQGNSARPLVGTNGNQGVFAPLTSKSWISLDDGSCQKTATLAGCGISVNSMWNVVDELKQGKLIRVLPEYTVEDNTSLWLVYPKSNVLTAKVRVFIDFIIENVGPSVSF